MSVTESNDDGPESSRVLVPALAAAVGAGIDHVVFLSVIGADKNSLVPHAMIESWLDARGVAGVGVRCFLDHRVGAFDLTGPESLDYHEVAAILSAELDHRVTYDRPRLLSFCFRRLRREHSPSTVLVMAGIYTTARLGFAARVTDDIRGVLGREPQDLSSFVRDHRSAWS